jgi:hypothetical protein
MDLDLARDVLDQNLVDRNDKLMGRIDGLVVLVDGDAQPRVDRFELGFVVLARRLHPRIEKWVNALRRWSVRKEAVQVVPWSNVAEITQDYIKVTIDATETPAFAWERWLRDAIVSKIPGSGAE